ncbi:biliverdin-producing heme oxygenase [Microbacterium sp. CFBP 8790]|uniref:biliverdin-producing heme oxygenase n=1 Tax=unclassified Microbacterium TaxID=2609290 RepID=UPI001785648E|nr:MULTISPECIES: biliverdin-producing heme oxygenase [unclassified Microbacterium]MBD8206762.1 biliverdin-producing heme oxygenase [Microbacterium sp. CFBP 8801]MBD8509181.1 biliverdin-producing heme oxygenase [Microbacterium sp. CFBP 8790]
MNAVIPFSTALRERSSSAHSTNECDGFMTELLTGSGTRDDYVALVAQHWFIYSALEESAVALRRDPVASVFLSDKLTRLPALEADLAFLLGADWRESITPLPTTQAYVSRIRRVAATWPGGFVAHHYTRYLGDLSGGQFIGRLMQRRFGFDTNGIGFFLFGDIADPKAFKSVYREQLDAAPWDDDEKERVIAEVLVAYRFNTELFADLARAKAAQVA